MSGGGRTAGDRINEILASGVMPDQLAATIVEFVGRGTDPNHMLTLLDAYLRHPEWETDFEQALASAEKFTRLSTVTAELMSKGADVHQVRFRLEAFHLQLVSQNREQDDDVVLEVLDELVGF